MPHDLVLGWRNCNLASPPYLFPDDVSHIGNGNSTIFRSFDEYISSKEFGLSSDVSLHTGQLPQPFIGNLEKASIFVLMLNPGLSTCDYFAEQYGKEFRNAYIRNLRQENENDEYPFFFLNPQFAWHPGFDYWHKKLGGIIETLAKQSGITRQKAMSKLSKKMACIELVPYHSKHFDSQSLLKTLPSINNSVNFVHEVLIPKAKDSKVVIIAVRGVKNWRLPLRKKNIVIYKSSESLSAHLTLSSHGGKAIANHLSLKT